jgi:2,3-bisphosphoglycerate-independent phosphoglycerate mutase
MTSDDELIFYNFRADRERQICDALLKDDFDQFENNIRPNFVSMFRYRKEFENPVIFEKQIVENTLGEKIEEAGLSQLRVAESQKRPHVTYFFNGQRELEFENEDRYFVESDKIKSYDQKPEMHAEDTTDRIIQAIELEDYDFIMLNYANCDLVGHTGEMDAAVKAAETVDENIGRLAEAVKGSEFGMIVTADHGNCEDMGSSENPNTSHTTNRVPVIGVDVDVKADEDELWEISSMIQDSLNL